MMIRRASLCAVALLTLTAAWAEPVSWWDSRDMVDRIRSAELIVVAHVAGEISKLPEPQHHGMVFFYRGRLAVDEVLKGDPPSGGVSFLLPANMPPTTFLRDGELVDAPWRGEHPASALLLFGGDTAVVDFHKPAVWVLAHYANRFGPQRSAGSELGVHGRGSVQPIATKPFFAAVLRDAPAEELTGFLDDAEPSVRALALQYLTEADEKSAFPKVAELLGDEEIQDPSLPIRACTQLGGKAAIPFLRPLLDAEDQNTSARAANALAFLGDTDSVPRIIRLLTDASGAGTRNGIAQALAQLGDRRAVPALIAALKDDRFGSLTFWPSTWKGVGKALLEITGCRLSRNGDKVERWWAVAEEMDGEAWEHFAIAELIRGLTAMGPRDNQETRRHLAEAADIHSAEKTWNLSYFYGRGHYDPAAAQTQWLAWLERQRWDDWQALPSQVDDELQLTVEPTATLDSGGPVHLRYTIRNASDHDIWLCKQYAEVPSIWFAGGIGHHFYDGFARRPGPRSAPSTEGDFFQIPRGESRFVIGGSAIYNAPGGDRNPRPRSIVPGLRFCHTGTTLGLDAWVGEVWAGEIKFPVEPGY